MKVYGDSQSSSHDCSKSASKGNKVYLPFEKAPLGKGMKVISTNVIMMANILLSVFNWRILASLQY